MINEERLTSTSLASVLHANMVDKRKSSPSVASKAASKKPKASDSILTVEKVAPPLVPPTTDTSPEHPIPQAQTGLANDSNPTTINPPSGLIPRQSSPSPDEWEASPPPPLAVEFPGHYKMDADFLKEYNTTLLKRILTFMTYQKESANTYAIDRMPAHSWGTDRPLDDKSSLLCQTGTNNPILFWAVGKVSRLWFFNNNGEYAPQVAIHIVPLSNTITSFCHRTIATLSEPKTTSVADGGTDIRASRWQNVRTQGQRSADVQPFRSVFQATDVYSGKHDMPSYPVEDLGLRDLVLLEVNVGRYKLRDETESTSAARPNKKWKKASWTKWRAQYELVSISLLHKSRFPDGLDTAAADDECDTI